MSSLLLALLILLVALLALALLALGLLSGLRCHWGFFGIFELFLFFILIEFILHVSNGVSVQLGLDRGGSLDHVEILQEFIETHH